MTALRKLIVFVLVLGVVGALLYFNLDFERTTGPEVEVEAVERRSLEALVSASGKIEPKLSVDISASTMGRVSMSLHSQPGSGVASSFAAKRPATSSKRMK